MSKDGTFAGAFEVQGGSGYFAWAAFEDTISTALETASGGQAFDVVDFIQVSTSWTGRRTYAQP